MSEKLKILDDSSDSEVELSINKDYAKRYNAWRNKEELQKYKDLKKEEDESDSSSESEEEPPEFDEEFFRALSLLKGKDPRIYDKNFELFSEKYIKKKKSVKEKPMFMKDYERTLVLEKGGEFSEDEETSSQVKTFEQDQDELKESFKQALDEDGGDDDDDDLLQVRTKTKSEEEEEEADYLKWLKGEEKEVPEDMKKDMVYLRNYWNDPKLDEGEKFLRDYILNKRYLEKDDSDIPTYEELTSGALSDDEKMIEEQEKFEHKYNFRFEEPDEEFIKRYPRTIGDSLRKADNRRKQKRDEKAERIRREKEQRKEELKRLKALKRKEIEEKFLKIKEISGQDEINLNESDMESEFDPDKHDQKMRELFNEDYYQVEEEQKPEFPFDEELDAENWNNWTGEQMLSDTDEKNNKQLSAENETKFDDSAEHDPKYNLEKEMIEATQPKKKPRKKSLFAKVISQPKPIYDPEGKSFEEYLDEYYKLDYEDVVGDMPVRYKYRKVIPNDFGLTVDEILAADDRELNRWCSVKKTCQYRNNDEELYEVQAYKKKSQNLLSKKKILASVYAPKKTDAENFDAEFDKHNDIKESSINSHQADNAVTSSSSNLPKKRKQIVNHQDSMPAVKSVKKARSDAQKVHSDDSCSQLELEESVLSLPSNIPADSGEPSQASSLKKKKKKKKRKNKAKTSEETAVGQTFSNSIKIHKQKKDAPSDKRLGLSDERLAAYGINPKKFKSKIVHAKK